MDLKLKWDNLNVVAATVKIYRGTAELDRANLSNPLVTLTAGETEWIDTTAVLGTTYFYVFETITATDHSISRNHRVIAGNRRGPGPQTVIEGNLEYGYFGEILPSEFISTNALRDAVGMTIGSATGNPTAWHKYVRKGKILIVPNASLTSSVTWMNLYNLGIVYGTDDDGKGTFIPTPTVNQRKTVKIGADTFIVRLMTGYSDNVADVPPTTLSDSDNTDNLSCEWDDLIYPLFQYTPVKQRLANVASYTLTQMRLNTQPTVFVQERASVTQNVTRGGNANSRAAVATRGINGSTGSSSSTAWWPVLELVETAV